MTAERILVGLGERSYPIDIGPGLLSRPELFAPHTRSGRAALVTSEQIAPLYADSLTRTLERSGTVVQRITLPDGEARKEWASLDAIFSELLRSRADRQTLIIALGGGVVGDIAGFAAATYQRGVPFIQVPTTLLAQVDSSVGGKTAINHPLGKNMIGAFHQPRAVVADTDTLQTLPDRELAAGLAEVVKYGAIRDPAFFGWLESHIDQLQRRDADDLAYAIRRSCEIKSEIVALDERELGIRALLNFGHTFGHAIETLMGYGTWLHGEAVAAGMAMAARLSVRLDRLQPGAAERLVRLLERAGLPVNPPAVAVDDWLEAMGRDKKNESGRIILILLDALGSAAVDKQVPLDALKAVLAGE